MEQVRSDDDAKTTGYGRLGAGADSSMEADWSETSACRERSLRRAAFLSVALSTTAILAAVVGLPLCYNYALRVQSFVQSEAEFCRVSGKVPFACSANFPLENLSSALSALPRCLR